MKKILLLLLSVVPLLFTSCFGLWGPHNEDIMTDIEGIAYINGEKILGSKVYKQDKIPENASKPYIIWSFKTNTGIELDAFCATSETWTTSFEIGCFVKNNPEFPKVNKELMDNAVLSFTYEPVEGDSITVNSSGANWEIDSHNWYYFTLDFDTKTFIPNELK